MMRRFFVLAAVLLLSGLVPLAASAGFCARRVCCRTQSNAGTAAVGSNPGCCKVNNGDTANHNEATNAKALQVQLQLASMAVGVPATTAVIVASDSPRRTTGSPPPTRERLATLSILLV